MLVLFYEMPAVGKNMNITRPTKCIFVCFVLFYISLPANLYYSAIYLINMINSLTALNKEF